MDAALVALVGVIVGAAISPAVNWLMARRREHRESRTAVRLLCMDLHKVLAVTEPVRVTGSWGDERGQLPTRAFDSHESILARDLSPELWKATEGSVLGTLRLDGIRQSLLAEGREATEAEMRDAVRICSFIERALKQLDDEAWAIERPVRGESRSTAP